MRQNPKPKQTLLISQRLKDITLRLRRCSHGQAFFFNLWMNALELIQIFYYSYSRSWYMQVKDASNLKRAIVHFIVFVCHFVRFYDKRICSFIWRTEINPL